MHSNLWNIAYTIRSRSSCRKSNIIIFIQFKWLKIKDWLDQGLHWPLVYFAIKIRYLYGRLRFNVTLLTCFLAIFLNWSLSSLHSLAASTFAGLKNYIIIDFISYRSLGLYYRRFALFSEQCVFYTCLCSARQSCSLPKAKSSLHSEQVTWKDMNWCMSYFQIFADLSNTRISYEKHITYKYILPPFWASLISQWIRSWWM